MNRTVQQLLIMTLLYYCMKPYKIKCLKCAIFPYSVQVCCIFLRCAILSSHYKPLFTHTCISVNVIYLFAQHSHSKVGRLLNDVSHMHTLSGNFLLGSSSIDNKCEEPS